MDKESIYGIRYEVDIDQLKTSTKEAANQIKLANAQFKESISSMDNWATSTDGLSAKVKQLSTILEAEKVKLNNLKKSYNDTADSIQENGKEIDRLKEKRQQAINTYGAESSEVQNLTKEISKLEREQTSNISAIDRLKISMANQQATVNRTEKSLNSYQQELDDVKEATLRAEKSGNSLEDELRDIKKQSEDTKDSIENMGGGFTVLKGAIAGFIANGISSLVSGLASIVEESQETIEDLGKLETAFTTSGHSAEAGKKVYEDFVGILGETDQSVEAANHLAKLTKSQDELAKWTDIAAGVYATFGDSLPLEGLTEAANETAKVGQVTGPLADALNWAGVSEDKFNESLAKCNSEQERSTLITNTLNGLYQEASTKYQTVNKDLIDSRKATAELKEAQAELGSAVLPIMNKMKFAAADLLSTFVGFLTGNLPTEQFVSKISGMVTNVVNTVGTLAPKLLNKGIEMIVSLSQGFVQGFPNMLTSLLNLVQNIGDYLTKNMPKFIQKGFEILSNLVQGITNAIPVLIKKVPEIIITFANLINDNFPTILKKGAELLLQFIKGILSAIPTLIANIPKIIQAIISVILAYNWLSLGKNIITFFGNGIKSMVGFIQSKAGDIFNTVLNALKNLPQTLWELAKSMISRMGNAITNSTGTVRGAIKGVYDAVVNGLKGLPKKMMSIGSDLVKGLWNGIKDMVGWIGDKIKGFGDSVLGGLKDFFGIHSPSKETEWQGNMLVEGYGNALVRGTKALVKKAKTMSKKVLDSFQSDLDSGVSFNANVQGLKTKTNNSLNTMKRAFSPTTATSGTSQNINNVTFNQYNTSPKPIDSLEVYRNTQKQMKIFKQWKGAM